MLAALVLATLCISSTRADEPREGTPTNGIARPVDKSAADTLFEKANALYKEGPEKADATIKVLQEALGVDPTHRKSAMLLAITYFGTKQFEKALAAYDTALDLDHRAGRLNPRLHFLKARCLAALSRFDEAQNLLVALGAVFEGTNDAELSIDVDTLKSELSECIRRNTVRITLAAVAEVQDLGFDATPYLIATVDKDSHPSILGDSDIKPYVPPIVFDKNLRAVVFIPEKTPSPGRLVVLFDKDDEKSGVLIFGRPTKLIGDEKFSYKLTPVTGESDNSDADVPLYAISKAPEE